MNKECAYCKGTGKLTNSYTRAINEICRFCDTACKCTDQPNKDCPVHIGMAKDREHTIMDDLLWKSIETLELTPDNESLRFTTTTGEQFAFFAEGDCCSQSWFQHISGIDYLVGGEVCGIEKIDLGETDITQRSERIQEYEQAYSFNFKTSKGDCVIEMRNASNGYYGGYIQVLGLRMIEQYPQKYAFKKVAEDF